MKTGRGDELLPAWAAMSWLVGRVAGGVAGCIVGGLIGGAFGRLLA